MSSSIPRRVTSYTVNLERELGHLMMSYNSVTVCETIEAKCTGMQNAILGIRLYGLDGIC